MMNRSPGLGAAEKAEASGAADVVPGDAGARADRLHPKVNGLRHPRTGRPHPKASVRPHLKDQIAEEMNLEDPATGVQKVPEARVVHGADVHSDHPRG